MMQPQDFRDFRQLSYKGALMFLDESNYLECITGETPAHYPKCNEGYYVATSRLYANLTKAGFLAVKACSNSPTLGDNLCEAVFTE